MTDAPEQPNDAGPGQNKDGGSEQPRDNEPWQPGTDDGKGKLPEPCGNCGEKLGHKENCACKYRRCWTLGMNKRKARNE
ncbi:hypothetical protein G6O67_005067 [Ophiocordyceps sinensis]|uniref:Uncharacterized protein n=2 Tax=Ophiocordyceps sinensis TaxID=72228 RepID=A0A8H4PQT3_9HYPO|nr:hypothetical protein OCS_02618 [Ophiocordyceps sinensis CO18]KAF4508725.1 hypothetical protein G6O67_005067 [Ophiocordyceps sinensis]